MQEDIFVLEGARTPFGAFGGSFKDVSAIDLGAVAARGALERSQVPPADVDHVVFGNVLQTSSDAIYLARHIGLKSGVPVSVPALTVNRLCGSGLQAMITGAQAIILSEARTVLAGGAENMSQAPYVVRGARWGLRMGTGEFQDYLWEALTDPYCGCDMANTAENLAEEYGIARDEVDVYALRSQRLAAEAEEKCYFSAEIVPVEIPARKKTALVSRDEHIRVDTTMDALTRLPAVFRDGGVVTAGNASGIVDGAGAVVLASGDVASTRRPLGRIVSWSVVGVEPRIMGIGPARAIPVALDRAGISLDDVDLFEINEAFSAQYLAVERELRLDRDRVNVNGGAIALGHPLAASGARLGLTLLYELRRRGARFGVASACIGGGQGIAVVFECLDRSTP
ncbi:MAG: acetyl-CoA C-acetyltransferase [Chloroflexota bacterium]